MAAKIIAVTEVTVSLAGEESAPSIARVINEAYAISEGEFWRDGVERATPSEVKELIRRGEMLAAHIDGRLVGCASLEPVNDSTSEVHFVSATPDSWGSGVGRALMGRAEALARSRGTRTLQLKLLVPSEGIHPLKEQLRDWYTRIGFSVVGSLTVAQVSRDAVAEMAQPCEFLVFHKPLSS
jgi:N-acetylglutamate synthase-like GNAT family acetyltransferase